MQKLENSENHTPYRFEQSMTDGIERIVCHPQKKLHKTPILLVHGYFHGAWIWRDWQKFLAGYGWESHAFSLPGHGKSPRRRATRLSTMQYYVNHLRKEVERIKEPPILMSHSMGGAITQWYLKRSDHVAAVVMVAGVPSHSTYASAFMPMIKRDPVGLFLLHLTLSASPYVRNPRRTEETLLSRESNITGRELFKRLDQSPAIPIVQHNPPLWYPPDDLKIPILWVSAQNDAIIPENSSRKSADHYGAQYVCIQNESHNLMMEPNRYRTIEMIEVWIAKQSLG